MKLNNINGICIAKQKPGEGVLETLKEG